MGGRVSVTLCPEYEYRLSSCSEIVSRRNFSEYRFVPEQLISARPMLRLAEETMLLILDDVSGEFARVPKWPLQCALAGGVLMDLALENRIDTDPERLFLIDSTPVGDDILDPVLTAVVESPETYDTRYWVQHTAEHAERIRVRALERLVERGILQHRKERFLWVFPSRRYPTVDGKARLGGSEASDHVGACSATDSDPRDTQSSVSPTPAAYSRSCCRSASWSAPPRASRRCSSLT